MRIFIEVILFFTMAFTMVLPANCQVIGNMSFEEWKDQGIYEHPLGWTSSNDFSSSIGFQGVYLDSSAFDGILAARIITTNIGFAGAPYAGFIVNGKMNVSGHHDIDSIIKAGEPFTGRPDALSGYYRYESDAFIEDWAHAFVILKKYDSINKRADTIAYGENVLLNPSGEYRYFTVEIDYFENELNPDSIVVAFFSTYPENPISGGRLWVDNISLEYATGSDEVMTGDNFKLYPNPAAEKISIGSTAAEFISIFNTSGQLVSRREDCRSIDIAGLLPGLYYMRIENDSRHFWRKFIKK